MSIDQSEQETPKSPKSETKPPSLGKQTSVRANDLLALDEQSRKKQIAKNTHKIFFEDKKLLKTMSNQAMKRFSMNNLNLIGSLGTSDQKRAPITKNVFKRQST